MKPMHTHSRFTQPQMMKKAGKKTVQIVVCAMLATMLMATGTYIVPMFYETPNPPAGRGTVDSAAIWVSQDPTQPSLLFVTDKDDFVHVYDATQDTFITSIVTDDSIKTMSYPNGIGVAYDIPTANGEQDVLFVVERDAQRVSMWHLPSLSRIGEFGDGILGEPYGVGFHWRQDTLDAWITDTYLYIDETHVFKIVPTDSGLGGVLTATHPVGGTLESVLIDDYHDRVFFCDEANDYVLIHNLAGAVVDTFAQGLFHDDPEGIVLYETTDSTGYVIVTDQNASPTEFEVFDRQTLAWMGNFVGETSGTDGIAITQDSIPGLPKGSFYAIHSDKATHAYKWDDIAAAMGLEVVVKSDRRDPTIWVNSPNGGYDLEIGTTHTISWASSNFTDPVDVDFSADSGLTWTPIATNLTNTSTYDWFVPNTPTNTALVRVVDSFSGQPGDTSAATFSIVSVRAPSALSASTAEDGGIKLLWQDNASVETGFKIERRDSAAFAEIATVTPNTVTFTDTGLVNNTIYTYRIAALNGLDMSAYSNEDSALAVMSYLSPPDSNLAVGNPALASSEEIGDEATLAVDDDDVSYWKSGVINDVTPDPVDWLRVDLGRAEVVGRVFVNWRTDSYAKQFQIQVSNDDVNWTTVLSDGMTSEGDFYGEFTAVPARYVRIYMTENNKNTYRIEEFEIYSGPLPGPPKAPENLAVVALGQTQMTLTWKDKSGNETGFKLERGLGTVDSLGATTATFTQIATIDADCTSFVDSGLSDSTDYAYRLRSYNDDGDSGYSNLASDRTQDPPPPPAAPIDLVATVEHPSTIHLSWTDKAYNEDGFRIERHSGDSLFTEIDLVISNITAWSDTGLTPGTTYTYRVRSYGEAGGSAYTNEASETPMSLPNAPDSLVAVANGLFQIDLSWIDRAHDEDSIRVQRKLYTDIDFTEIAVLDSNAIAYSDTGLAIGTGYIYRVLASNHLGNSEFSNADSAFTGDPPAPPPAPYNFIATTNSMYQMNLSWADSATTELGFKLERKAPGDSAFSQIAALDSNVTAFSDSGLTYSTSYDYRISAYHLYGQSAWSDTATGVTTDPPPPPPAPTALAGTADGMNQVNLTWTDNSTTENGFKLERKLSADSAFAQIAVIAANATAFSDSGLTHSTSYDYRLRAYHDFGHSIYSDTATIVTADPPPPPAAPVALAATANGMFQIDLTWADSSSTESGFKLERKTAADTAFSEIATIAANATAHSDSGLAYSTTYQYRLRAFHDFGESAHTDTASVTTDDPPPPPAAPVAFSALANGVNQIDMSWQNAATNAEGFKLERREGGGAFAQIALLGVNDSTYNDTGLPPGTDFTYRIRAYHQYFDSDYSNEVMASTDAVIYVDPTVNIALNKTISAPSADDEDVPAMAVDGNFDTKWESLKFDDTDTLQWLKVDFGELQPVGHMFIDWKGSNWASNFDIETSSDEVNWTTVFDTTKADSESDDFHFNQVLARYVRLNMRTPNSSSYKIYEWEIYAGDTPTVPAAPTSLTATANDTSTVTLNWTDNSADENSFKIERKSGGSGYSLVATVSTNITTWADSGLTPATTYTYRVRANNGAGNSGYSNEANATTDAPPGPPEAPTALLVTGPGIHSVSLSWTDNAVGETGFKIERQDSAGAAFVEIAAVGADTTAFTNAGLNFSTNYNYRIFAYGPYGNSAFSDTVAATTNDPPPTPVAPSFVSATANGMYVVDLNWTSNSGNGSGFKLEKKSPADSAFSQIALLDSSVTAYSDSGLTYSTTYDYRVRAYHGYGESAWSDTASVATDDPPPPPAGPTDMTATTTGMTTIALSWIDNANTESGFELYRKMAADSSFNLIAVLDSNTTAYNDSGLAVGTTYDYGLRSFIQGFAQSITMAEASAKTADPPPAVPSALAATANGMHQIDLTWTDNSTYETGFKVESRRIGVDSSFAQIASLDSNVTAFSDSGLVFSTTYEYRVSAFYDFGQSAWSDTASATTDDPPPPAAPSAIAAAATGMYSMSVTWTDNANDEVGFKLERKLTADSVFAEIAVVDSNVTAFSDSGLTYSTSYDYRVRAYNPSGNSAYGDTASAVTNDPPPPPTAPSALIATANGRHQIDLSWTDNSSDETQFKLERKLPADSAFAEIVVLDSNVTAFSDSGLTWSTTYQYRVRAAHDFGASTYSDTAAATTDDPLPTPEAPTALAAASNGTSQIDLSWSDNAINEDGFILERKLDGGAFATVDSVGANLTAYADSGLSPNSTYTYRLVAFNNQGNSAASNEALATTDQIIVDPNLNLALNRIYAASSEDSEDTTGFAFDADLDSKWESLKFDETDSLQWLKVDFGEVLPVGRSFIDWKGGNYATAFDIEVSLDDSLWTTVFDTTKDDSESDAFTFTQTLARHARLNMRAANKSAYKIYEWEIYAGDTPLPPTAPSALSATANGMTRVDLAWTDNAGDETGFKIERKSGAGVFSQIAQVGVDVTAFADSGLTASTTYTYRVRATNLAGNSGYTNDASATTDAPPLPPAAPGNLTVAAVSASALNLSWADSSDNESGFKIERQDTSGAFVEIATVTANQTSYGDAGLTASTSYNYRVKAYNGTGDSGYSNEASGTTHAPPPPPAAPTALAAIADGMNQVNLTWTDNASGETGFKLERKLAADSVFAQIALIDSNVTAFSDSGLTASTSYDYRLRAYNETGDSGYGNTASATTDAPPPIPTAPGNLVATASGTDQINLAWADSSNNEDGFKIERKTGAEAFAEIANVAKNDTTFSDAGLTANTAYTYRILAYNISGNSGYSNEAADTTDQAMVDPTVNLALGKTISASSADGDEPETLAIDGDLDTKWSSIEPDELNPTEWLKIDFGQQYPVGKMFIDWKGGSYASEFNVEVSLNDLDWTTVFDTTKASRDDDDFSFKQTTARYVRLNLRQNASSKYKIYEWEIYAGTAPPSPPAAPSALSATADGSTVINLAWTDNASVESEFKIERKTGAGAFAQIASVGADVTAFADSGLTATTSYTYRVRAANGAGDSGYSNEASATTEAPPTPPSAPTALAATTAGASSIDLIWNDNSGNEDGFKIERKTGAAAFAQVASVPADSTTYTDTGLTPSTTYMYRLIAFNDGGNSSTSNEASATTDEASGADPSINLALNKPGEASSEDSGDPIPDGLDGDLGSHFDTQSVEDEAPVQWLSVDLEQTEIVGRVIIRWKSSYYATAYEFQTSDDNATWTTVHTAAKSEEGDDEFTFGQVAARYVRLLMTGNNKSAYKINELEVYSGPLLSKRKGGLATEVLPVTFALHQNYPNPFNPSTQIRFDLPESRHVTLKIYNILGSEVAILADRTFTAGFHTLRFNGKKLSSGVYIFKITAGDFEASKRMTLVK